ncbi:hypothetical protein [Bacillus sp. FJAT-45350]|uniref:hypothetical protein n=1 Tax=Bacillus sp. FJAT-45350 TaxID=2011014 RepID=UPI0015C7D99E|nr:hypothetical protein [Bacillus sp. FJAT-45350]
MQDHTILIERNTSSTAEQFQKEKQLYALSSKARPTKLEILNCNVRQTQFPILLNRD